MDTCRLGALGTYLSHFEDDFLTLQGLRVLTGCHCLSLSLAPVLVTTPSLPGARRVAGAQEP